ncbi:MAG TPA: hypothetical protein VF666_12040 [Pyrinomonadaceae bacterium]|jgi:hypothetical protein
MASKTILTLAGIVLVVPFFSVALFVGQRAVVFAQGAGNDMLLVALAMCGAGISVINGMGRHLDPALRTARQGAGVKENSSANVLAASLGR